MSPLGGGCFLPPYGGSISPMCIKTTYCVTIVIKSKCFEFQKDWLEIIRIRYNCMQFRSIPSIKGIKKFNQQWNFLNDKHQNLISSSLY